ncbi:MAG: hypothetical protein JWN41_1648 [Thermoleophilia bacterium]|nr:hypothetical protein [Thermoleophilia bacterium]
MSGARGFVATCRYEPHYDEELLTFVTDQTDIATIASHATTLDDATLRRIFASAAADLSMPESKGAVWRMRISNLWAARRGTWLAVFAAAGLISLVALVSGYLVVAITVVCTVLATVVIVLGVQSLRATRDYMQRYAETRGLALTEDTDVPADVPLLKRGDKRSFDRCFTGTIAGRHATLAHYTYTEVRTDSEGRRSESDFPWTVLEFELPPAVAARYAGVYLSPRKFSFGALQDRLAHDHQVQLESADFHRRYTLRVDDDQDEVALYELFSTTFVDLLATDLEITWEQVGSSLVLYRKKHLFDVGQLDRFCLEGWHVLERYLAEWQ